MIHLIVDMVAREAIFDDINNVNRVQENISKRPGSWSSWL